ncbi:hypothetical protein MKEN_00003500 [Mycena kentingensis (nom. inval.)]|nr:hypothetical protein MKEN_00003500 [Mycena kentingensis (nom. inval.)]
MAPTPPTMDQTYGIWVIALTIQSTLFGMGLLQAYLYFFWYPKDNWVAKSAVILITVLETIQTAFFTATTYKSLVTEFGNFPNLDIIDWTATTQLQVLYTSTFVAQIYFAWGIYLFRRKEWLYPLLVAIVAIAALGAGIAQTVLVSRLTNYSQLGQTSAATNTQAALAFACDIMITVGLWWRLSGSKGGIQSTNRLLNFLIMTAINRGVLTMLTALLNIILFLAVPGTFEFMAALLISGKLYMNSMLAMLNTRAHATSIAKGATVMDGESFSMNAQRSQLHHTGMAMPRVTVIEETHINMDHDMGYGKKKPQVV